MKTQNPHYREQVRAIFDKAPFIADLGIILSDLGPGWCESVLAVAPERLSTGRLRPRGGAGDDGRPHGRRRGGDAGPIERDGPDRRVQDQSLAPRLGDRLRCRATVLKPGKTLIVAESEVYAVRDGKEKLVAKATVTLAPVEAGK